MLSFSSYDGHGTFYRRSDNSCGAQNDRRDATAISFCNFSRRDFGHFDSSELISVSRKTLGSWSCFFFFFCFITGGSERGELNWPWSSETRGEKRPSLSFVHSGDGLETHAVRPEDPNVPFAKKTRSRLQNAYTHNTSITIITIIARRFPWVAPGNGVAILSSRLTHKTPRLNDITFSGRLSGIVLLTRRFVAVECLINTRGLTHSAFSRSAHFTRHRRDIIIFYSRDVRHYVRRFSGRDFAGAYRAISDFWEQRASRTSSGRESTECSYRDIFTINLFRILFTRIRLYTHTEFNSCFVYYSKKKRGYFFFYDDAPCSGVTKDSDNLGKSD